MHCVHSTVNCVSETVHCVYSTVNCVRGTVHIVRGTVNYVSETVHCEHSTVNCVRGTVNYVSRTIHSVRGTVNCVYTRDEHMFLAANVVSTLESCVNCSWVLQCPVWASPSLSSLSDSGYIFATNFTAWFYHVFSVCSRKYFYCAKFPIDIKIIPLHFKQTAPYSVLRAWFY